MLLVLLATLLSTACGPVTPAAAPGLVASAPAPSPTATPLPTPSVSAAPAPAAIPGVIASSVIFGREAQGVGDPNPFFQDGRYYVFYLQNEGRHPWRMSSSSDLSTWTAPIEAVPVGNAGDADYWTGSGSVVADPAGGYRIFYTGHLPNGDPMEVTMASRSDALGGPWRKVAAPRFAGSPAYDRRDFRDPFVFRNEETGTYWMLLTSRSGSKAAVVLYTSPDLETWSLSPPLYTEASPLNLEVPDVFREGPDWFLIFSDQRDASRQTRYLRAASSRGTYSYGSFDALDGRGFYAGKTAGNGPNRLLFGWVASRRDRRDDTELLWGGDLVAHAIRRTPEGALAVDVAEPLARQFAKVAGRLSLGAPSASVIDQGTRIIADLIVRPGDRFGIRFALEGSDAATAEIDTAGQEARFVVGGRTLDAPRVAFPGSPDGRYHIDLVLDPSQGFGILYINRFRALSFRYYGMGGTTPSVYSEKGLFALDGEVRTK
jgi:beta-fructofuranosidase